MKRQTSRWSPLAAAAGAMLSLSALGGAAVTDGVLVISVDSGSENVGDPVDSFSKIRKVGGGTAVLTDEEASCFGIRFLQDSIVLRRTGRGAVLIFR